MRKIVLLVFLLISLKGIASEDIKNYTVEITLNPDRSVTVKETIAINVEGINIRRGIYRDIINVQESENKRTIRYPVDVLGVMKDGKPEPYTVEELGQAVRVKIGNPEILLEHRVHVYEITYSMPEQVRFFDNYDELYWNAIGAQWDYIIEKSEAIINLPVSAKIIQYSGYTGEYGSTTCDCKIEKLNEHTLSIETTSELYPYQGLSIAAGFSKGAITPPSEEDLNKYVAKPTMIYIVSIGGIVIVFLLYSIAWYFVGRDPMEGTIIPRFYPNEGISPAASRSLSRMGFDNKSFTASIINLGVKGVIKIEKTDDGYKLIKVEDNPKGLFREEKKVFDNLLSMRKEFSIGNKFSSTLQTTLSNHKDSLRKELTKTYFNRNQGWLVPGIIISIVTIIAACVATLNYDEDTFVGLIPVGFASLFIFPVIITLIKKLSAAKRLAQIISLVIVSMIIGYLGYNYFGILDSFQLLSTLDLNVVYLFGGVCVGFLTLHILFAYLLKAPTIAGRKLMDEVEGLRMYLDVAEKERLAAMHAPEQTIEHFEKLLPYAIALDVEKHWSQRFESILAQSESADGYHPTWYSGPMRGWALGSFANDIGRSFNSSVSSASTPPPSSSSSSGSGGGGFSGGGGGGGGGGGW